MEREWAPPLVEAQRYKHVKLGDALEIRDGIIFDIYLGLPHVTTRQKGYENAKPKRNVNVSYM